MEIVIMATSILEEALADAKKLREVAEQNAKNAIIESISPKIKDMIEKQILGEAIDTDSDFFDSSEVELTTEAAEALVSMVEKGSENVPTISERVKILRQGFVNNEVTTELISELSNLNENANSETLKTSVSYLNTQREKNIDCIEAIFEHVNSMSGISYKTLRGDKLKKHLAMIGIAEKAISAFANKLNENKENSGLFITEIQAMKEDLALKTKEINEMKRSLRELLSEEAVDLRVRVDLGDDVEVELSPEDVSVELADAEEEAPEGEEELELDLDAEADDEGEADEGEAEAEVEADEEEVEAEEEESEENEGVDITSEALRSQIQEILDEMEEVDEGHVDEDEELSLEEDESEDVEEGLDEDEVVEISESMLRNELLRLRSLKENTKENTKTTEEVVNENNIELTATIEELQGQLTEVNLFNAKLLYTNKLLLNSDLTQTQRVRVIESLDEAKSLREVKLLYKGLTDSVQKKGLTESNKVKGSSSRAVRSASAPLNEGTENARWARLAGLIS